MGTPKALLKCPNALPLACDQTQRLLNAGCEQVIIILGSEHEYIREQLHPLPNNTRIVVNPDWPQGRGTSIRCGLSDALQYAQPYGCLILPVDTVGVKPDTLQTVLQAANRQAPYALRPIHNNESGKVLWLSHQAAQDLTSTPTPPKRLDRWIAPQVTNLPCPDPALLNNVNTPQDWQQISNQYW
jgi:CTP:molybdopterin cytidylyltransferase MocA